MHGPLYVLCEAKIEAYFVCNYFRRNKCIFIMVHLLLAFFMYNLFWSRFLVCLCRKRALYLELSNDSLENLIKIFEIIYFKQFTLFLLSFPTYFSGDYQVFTYQVPIALEMKM